MNAGELQDALTIGGFPSRRRGEEVLVQACWFCGNDRWNLELNPKKGVFSCWVCHESGRLDRLLTRTLGREFTIPVDFESAVGTRAEEAPEFESVPAADVGSALRYLGKRGLDYADLQAYDLRVCLEKGHEMEGRILFPLRDYWTMDLLGYVGRSYTGKPPKYRHTLSQRRICGYRTRDKSRPVLLVEGCLDGIAVHRAGFQAAILLGTSSSLIEEFVARIPLETPLGILLDGAAYTAASFLYWRIRPIREVTLIPLPGNLDPADLLPKTLRGLVGKSLKRNVDGTS